VKKTAWEQSWARIKILRRSCGNGRANASGQWTIFSTLSTRQFIAERRAVELTELAKEKGFDDNLMGAARSYGDVVGYVKHLMVGCGFRRRSVARSEMTRD